MLLETFDRCGIAENACALVKNSVPSWYRSPLSDEQDLTHGTIKTFIYQTVFWSTLLFAITLILVSIVQRKVNMHCVLKKKGNSFNHPHFMDSKLFAKNGVSDEEAG